MMPIPKNQYGEWPLFRTIEWAPGKTCTLTLFENGDTALSFDPNWPTPAQMKKLFRFVDTAHQSLQIEYKARTGANISDRARAILDRARSA
jgi:hypothetical protein